MSDESKHIDEQGQPLDGTSPDDAAAVMDEFVSPEDLVGQDLAGELQRVLDEVQSHLDDALTSPAKTKAAAEPADEEGVFQTPDEVLSTGVVASAAPDQAVASAEEITQQLAEMNDLIQEVLSPASVEQRASAPLNESPSRVADAAPEVAGEEAALPEPAGYEDEELLTPEQILGMSQAPASQLAPAPRPDAHASAAPATAGHAAAASETLGQLDEFLAGHADNAVSDEFETVHDVLAVEQAGEIPVVAPVLTSPLAPAAPAVPGTATNLNATLPKGAAPRDETAATDENSARTSSPDDGNAAAPAAPAVHVHHRGVPTDHQEAPPRSNVRRIQLAHIVRKATARCRNGVYRSCTLINRPLGRASDSTRALIGYAGLITVVNATLLLLGKLLFG